MQPTGSSATPTADNGDSGNATETGGNPNTTGSSPGTSSSSASSSGFNGPTFGGGPILGVASTSKEKSVRVFFQKNHYNDWLFIYIPQADRGGLLTGPINPSMQSGNLNGGLLAPNGAPQMPGAVLNPAAQNTPTPPTQNPGQTPPPEQ